MCTYLYRIQMIYFHLFSLFASFITQGFPNENRIRSPFWLNWFSGLFFVFLWVPKKMESTATWLQLKGVNIIYSSDFSIFLQLIRWIYQLGQLLCLSWKLITLKVGTEKKKMRNSINIILKDTVILVEEKNNVIRFLFVVHEMVYTPESNALRKMRNGFG